MPSVKITTTNYSGHAFSDFYVTLSPHTGPGWYVYGRNNEKYCTLPDGKGAYTMLCARPDVPVRKHRHYNISVQRGWRTKREAQAIADRMNAGSAALCFIAAAMI